MANGSIASSDLQWLLLKNGNSFTHKRVGSPFIFSAEKGNLRNIHTHKFSGLANARTFHVEASASGKGVKLIKKKNNASPFAQSGAYESKRVKGKSGRKTAGLVAKEISHEGNGRLDLRTAALARASAILATQTTRKEKRQRALRGTKKAAAEPADEE